MNNQTNSYTLYAQDGNEYKISADVQVDKGSKPNGGFPAKEIIEAGETKQCITGFTMSDPTQGTLTAVDNECAVIYKQTGSLSNTITFTSIDGRKTIVNIVNASTFIHTHQSIGQGGPAYGTYFRDRTNDE